MKIINKILGIINPDPFASHNCNKEMVKKKKPLRVRAYHIEKYFRQTARYWIDKADDIHQFLDRNEESLWNISPGFYWYIKTKESLFLSIYNFCIRLAKIAVPIPKRMPGPQPSQLLQRKDNDDSDSIPF